MSAVLLTETSHDGASALELRSAALRLKLLPDVGAKVVSLFDLEFEREWLAPAGARVRPLGSYGDEWADYDRGGWDECFPSVAGGVYPAAPFTGTPLRDHGELWHRPWTWRREGDALVTAIHGLRFPYRFERRLQMAGRRLEIGYSVTNLCEAPLLCLWSMHALLRADPGTAIVFPDGTGMVVEFSMDESARRRSVRWPMLEREHGEPRDLSLARPSQEGVGVKLFSARGAVRRAAVQEPDRGTWIGFEVDTSEVPHVGLWLNEGRWPAEGAPLRHLAIEPTTGFADRLDVASDLGSATALEGGSCMSWSVSMTFGTPAASPQAFVDAAQSGARRSDGRGRLDAGGGC